jgi:hypothetical protein
MATNPNFANLNPTPLLAAIATPASILSAAAGQFWPILCKGAPTYPVYSGPPEIEKKWHKAMEDGRKLESSINDAMFAVQKERLDIQKHIAHYTDLIQTSIDAKLAKELRKFKLSADVIKYIRKIQKFMKMLQQLAQAIQNNLNQLAALEADFLTMIQANIACLSSFLSLICNLGLPAVPSIPSFFSNIFFFNGFSFALLKPSAPNFSAFTNFSFAQCLLLPTTNLPLPPTIIVLDGVTIGAVAGNVVPPLNGALGDPTQLTSPAYIAQLQGNSVTPIYDPNTINPATVLQGSLPDPAFIISAYQLPSATYKANVLSTVPAFESNPPVSQEYALLAENVSLVGIVASNYDKNLTAAWLYYIEGAHAGRAGTWLPNFEAVYQQYIQPSLMILDDPLTTVPWNTVINGPGTVNEPINIPLLDTLASMTPAAVQHILWQLSYIEASLLGYQRTTQFDSGADSTYLSTFTLADLDYVSTTYDATNTVTVILGADTADFPVSCTVPKAILSVFNQVVAIASANIAADLTYVTNRPQFRFTYNAFAVATMVDRFSQFWRTFNYNLQQLLTDDPYVVSRVASYAASLDSAIDPLGDTADYLQIQNDSLTRNRAWVQGTPLLPLPVPPQVTIGTLPGNPSTNTGWTGTSFDPQSFLNRPDIQSLPLPTQYTMLRTNESYASLMTTSANVQAEFDAAIAQGQAALASIQNNGFDATSSQPRIVKNAAPPLPLSFDQTTYDNTNFVTSPTLFTIQVTGLYVIGGILTWDMGPAGIRTLTLVQNSTITLAEEQTDILAVGPITQTFGVIQQLNAGDTLQVLVAQESGQDTDVIAGAEFSVMLVPADDAITQPVFSDVITPSADNQTRSLMANVTMGAGVAVAIQPNGGVSPVDPVSPPSTPFVDGVITTPVQQDQLADVGSIYGASYTIEGASFVPGGLIYAGPGGVLTQDYAQLITEVNWVVVVGRAVTQTMMLLEQQIPTQVI